MFWAKHWDYYMTLYCSVHTNLENKCHCSLYSTLKSPDVWNHKPNTQRSFSFFPRMVWAIFRLAKQTTLPPNKQQQKPPCFCSPVLAKPRTVSASTRQARNDSHVVSQGPFVLHVEMHQIKFLPHKKCYHRIEVDFKDFLVECRELFCSKHDQVLWIFNAFSMEV